MVPEPQGKTAFQKKNTYMEIKTIQKNPVTS